MKIDFKKLLPHLIAIGIFVALVFIYFSPLMEGKRMSQHDIRMWQGMSKEIEDFRKKYHSEPLWTNSMFSGMPAYQISVVYPANLVQHINTFLWLGFPTPANVIFMALLGFYLLLISLRMDWRLAIAGAFAYGFSTYNFYVLAAGHNSKVHAISLIPFVITGLLMAYNRGRILFGAALTGIGLALQIYANHVQITYYLMLMILIFLIFRFIDAIKQKQLGNFMKASAAVGVAAAMAILTNITSLWATDQYGKDSTRGASELTEKKVSTGLDEDYAFDYSYGVLESFNLLIPNFMGGPSQSDIGTNSATYKALQENGAGAQARSFVQNAPLYWGDQPLSAGPTYLGAVTIFLFVLGMFVVKDYRRWWLLTATVFALFLAWGKNFETFNHLIFHYLPAYNKFRAVTMTLVIALFTVSFLAFLALQKFFSADAHKNELKKYLLRSFYIVGGICLTFVLIAGALSLSGPFDENLKQYPWLLEALKADRASVLRLDALRSFFFISLVFGMLWYYLKGKLKKEYVFAGIAVAVLLDMWTVDKRYLNNDNFVAKTKAEAPFTPSSADQQILSDKSLGYRVMNTTVSTFNDATTSYYHHSIGGYHGAKLKRYQELVERQISKNNMSVLNMLNTKYFIVSNQLTKEPMAQLNSGACGAAWFVKETKIVANADSEMNALSDFNPLQTSVADKRFEKELSGLKINNDSLAAIKLVAYEPNHLTYESITTSEQFAVFSEIYYDKGWNAYIDGNPSPHIRVNYVLRGMRVPAGNHKIEFKFEPTVYATGEKISLATSALLILLFIGILFLELKKGGAEPVAVQQISKKK